jgi:hypothetical protein
MKTWILITTFVIVSIELAFTQHQDPSWSVRRATINQQCIEKDSLCNVLHKLGTFEGHLRTFFMATSNHNSYPNYYALGVGGGLGYYSPIIKNFQVGMSGFIIYNMTSSHLGPRDGFNNRYELGLFDVSNPDNHEDLDRLEDLYLRYYVNIEKKTYVQLGKFHLKTPLINLQDGRMRPNLQEGIWTEWNNWEKIKLKGGFLWKTSPRGTIYWYDIGKSIGVYPMGRATNGAKADYAGHVKTKGIAVTNLNLLPHKNIKSDMWNYYVPDLQNTLYTKTEWRKKNEQIQWMVGLQYLWQRSLFKDTLAVERQYVGRNEKAHAMSARIARAHVRTGSEWNISYTRITKHGRFLFPREWGIEPFYTFMQRERIEGSGGTHALLLLHQRYLDEAHRLSLLTGVGSFWMPDVNNAALNKYAMPDYFQTNLRIQYAFTGFLQGLQADVLYMYKGNMEKDLTKSVQFYHNKIKMHHLSVVLDYYF